MIDKWADPQGRYAYLSQLMIDKWADMNDNFWKGCESASKKMTRMIVKWADPNGPCTCAFVSNDERKMGQSQRSVRPYVSNNER
jgi:hypothetical protein